MENQTMTIGNYLKANRIVHIAFIIGLLFFGIISFLLQLKGFGTLGEKVNKLFVYIIPVVSLIGIISSYLIFKRKLNECISKQNLKDKLIEYRTALISKFAIIEGTTFLALISYLLTGDLLLLSIAGILIIVFLTYAPTKGKLINDLALNFQEKQLIDNPDYEIN